MDFPTFEILNSLSLLEPIKLPPVLRGVIYSENIRAESIDSFAREWRYFYVERLKRNRRNRSEQVSLLGGGGKKMCSRFIGNTVTSCANLLNGKLKEITFLRMDFCLSKLQKYFIPRFFFPFSLFLHFNFEDIGQIRVRIRLSLI